MNRQVLERGKKIEEFALMISGADEIETMNLSGFVKFAHYEMDEGFDSIVESVECAIDEDGRFDTDSLAYRTDYIAAWNSLETNFLTKAGDIEYPALALFIR